MAGEQWCWDSGIGGCPGKYDVTFAREFRYDGTRQRYLDRELDPAMLEAGAYVVLSDTWSDYDGDDVYGVFTFDEFDVLVESRSYQPGMGKVDSWVSSGSTNTDYYHTDGLGTTRMMTDDLGVQGEDAAYTAFGEQISGASRRYGYVGEWGYQSHNEMPYQHVGARYYDPSSGRFLQRDPIGIRAGANIYTYVHNSPTSRIDPDGLEEFLYYDNDWFRDNQKGFYAPPQNSQTEGQMRGGRDLGNFIAWNSGLCIFALGLLNPPAALVAGIAGLISTTYASWPID